MASAGRYVVSSTATTLFPDLTRNPVVSSVMFKKKMKYSQVDDMINDTIPTSQILYESTNQALLH